MTSRLIIFMTLLALSGCASQIPASIGSRPNPDPEFNQVKKSISAFQNQQVRWGGKIISVANKKDSTWIEILANPLNSYGEPDPNTDYEGRFIAKIDGVLDPEHYAKDRKLTIFGTIETELVRERDNHSYSYPLVSTKEYYLWPGYHAVQYHGDDYYSPFINAPF